MGKLVNVNTTGATSIEPLKDVLDFCDGVSQSVASFEVIKHEICITINLHPLLPKSSALKTSFTRLRLLAGSTFLSGELVWFSSFFRYESSYVCRYISTQWLTNNMSCLFKAG